MGDKGRLRKETFYDESARVPLIVRPPQGITSGVVADSLVSLVDVFPTILEIGGCEPEAACFGKSLVPLLADPALQLNDAVFSEINDRVMIREGSYKMVVNTRGQVLKLYDLGRDPDEDVNLVGRTGTDETVWLLKERLLGWYLSTSTRQARGRLLPRFGDVRFKYLFDEL